MATRLAAVIIGVVLIAAALLTGCAHFLRPLEQPQVKVTGVSVSSVTLAGLDGQIDLDVFNPNTVSVPVRAIDWQLAVGGARAVSGRIDLAATVPARASAPVVAELHVAALDAAQVARRLHAGERGYTLSGTIVFQTSLGDLSVAFSHDGELATSR